MLNTSFWRTFYFFFEIAMIFKLFALENETFLSNFQTIYFLTIFEFQTTMVKGAR